MEEPLANALPAEGDVVDGKYRIERLVGEGAMGRVYRAHHLLLGHSVAIKLLRTSAETDEVRTRFVREAKATMALRSDHVVRVFDMGVLHAQTPYMVLELLEGTDLRSLLSTRGALPVSEAVDYVLQVCEALAEAHLNGIVHRDLKPQNLFLTRRPNGTACVKLLDFGVSKVEKRSGSIDELTMSHVMLGSPVFVSPEQIRDSSKVDARSDVWSLAVVLYMLLGGGRPFDGEGLPALCASITVDPPRPLSERCPAVPVELEAVIFRCLEKSREKRTANVAALARELEPFATSQGRVSAERVVHVYSAGMVAGAALAPIGAPPSLPATPPLEASGTSTAVEGTVIDPPRFAPQAEAGRNSAATRRRRWLVAIAPVAVVVAATTAFFARRGAPEPESIAAQPAIASTAEARPATPVAGFAPLVPEAPNALPSESPPPTSPHASHVARPAFHSGSPHTSKPAPPPATKKKGQVDRNGVPILD